MFTSITNYNMDDLYHDDAWKHLDRKFKFLESGNKYRVKKQFTDRDMHIHQYGEEWTFIGSSYILHHDDLSLFISLDGRKAWNLRFHLLEEKHQPIIDKLADYIEPIN